MLPVLSIENHQTLIPVPAWWLSAIPERSEKILQLVTFHSLENSVLAELTEVEIALVSNEQSAETHLAFMDIPGETDVITFVHGEIVISMEVAVSQAIEYSEPLGRELLRYIVHGLLHLAGHTDSTEQTRAQMECAQEEIVSKLWCSSLGKIMNK